jgi:hypothetical protein
VDGLGKVITPDGDAATPTFRALPAVTSVMPTLAAVGPSSVSQASVSELGFAAKVAVVVTVSVAFTTTVEPGDGGVKVSCTT